MKKFLKWVGGIVLLLLLLVAALIGPIDRTPLREQSYYQDMMAKLDTLQPSVYAAAAKLKVGWSTANITPSYPMPMGGYTPRPEFKSVHDSLYARIIAIDNGRITSFMVSTDLMLFPPALKERIQEKLDKAGRTKYFLYLSSTHTHNGVGGWNKSLLGRLVLGTYHDEWVEESAEKIVRKMLEAESSKQDARIAYLESEVSEWVENRLALDQGEIDGKLRGISIERKDGSKGIVFTFSAHATSISKKSLQLSGDYPAETVSRLKAEGWSFGMFMAGMVGSHRFKWIPQGDFEAIAKLNDILMEKLAGAAISAPFDSVVIKAAHVPIELGPAQMRIDKDLRVRNWAFSALAGSLQGELTFLQIGDVVFIGTPCDFSGEIYTAQNLAQLAGDRKLIITSFNGDYIGYITYDKHYEVLTKEEVMTMNWVGPYYGQYFTDMIRALLAKR